MMTGSLKKDLKKIKLKDFFFLIKKRGGSLIKACSLIRSNTLMYKLMFLIPRSATFVANCQ